MKRVFARITASEPAFVACAAIAIVTCAAMFLLQGRLGVNLQDEAFAWYGAVRTHAGDVPLRDFRAYDPGRYYWCSAWMSVLGDGLVAVRCAGWAFASIGLTAGLLTVARTLAGVRGRLAWLVLASVVLVAWMAPPWKLYESSLAMLVTWIAVRLIERPSASRRIAAGVAVGMAAFFGRNLGVYAGVALLAVTLVTCWRSRTPFVRSLVDLAAGTLVGYAPMLLLVGFVPGFRDALVDSIAFYARQDALNAELPFPYPWRVDLTGRPFAAAASALVVGTLFLAVPLTYAAVFVRGLIARTRADADAALIAIACVGAAWFHHASVRSDLPHMAQSVHPFLLLVLATPALFVEGRSRFARACAWSFLGIVSALGIGTSLPFVQRLLRGEGYTTVRVGTDELTLPPNQAENVRRLTSIVEANVGPEDELWVSAQLLGLYPMLGRHAPTWDIYPAWQADEVEQDRMLRELANVRWALIDVRPIGRDASMRLDLSHPRVWSWLVAEFERVPLADTPDSLVLLRRKP